MGDVRIALKELLRKHKDDTEVDVLKEGLVLLVQKLMEAKVKEKKPGWVVRANFPSLDLLQQLPGKAVGHSGWHGDTPDPQGPTAELLPQFSVSRDGGRRRRFSRWPRKRTSTPVSTRKGDDLVRALGSRESPGARCSGSSS